MYNINVVVCPRTIFNVKSVGENTCNNPNYNIHIHKQEVTKKRDPS